MTAEYLVAVHAIVYLNHRGGYLSSEELAANVCTNPARVRKVLSRLEKAGLVEVKNGYLGGYHFPCDPKTVTLLDVLDALDETLVATKWRSGSLDMDCQVASGMAGVMDGVIGEVNESGRKTLAGITIQNINDRLSLKGAEHETI